MVWVGLCQPFETLRNSRNDAGSAIPSRSSAAAISASLAGSSPSHPGDRISGDNPFAQRRRQYQIAPVAEKPLPIERLHGIGEYHRSLAGCHLPSNIACVRWRLNSYTRAR